MVIILSLMIGSATLVVQNLMANRNQEFSNIAYFAAESGAERIIWEVRINGLSEEILAGCAQNSCINFSNPPGTPNASCGPCDSSNIYTMPVTGATYQVAFSSSTVMTMFKSRGTYKEVTRSVEASFEF